MQEAFLERGHDNHGIESWKLVFYVGGRRQETPGFYSRQTGYETVGRAVLNGWIGPEATRFIAEIDTSQLPDHDGFVFELFKQRGIQVPLLTKNKG